MKSRNTGNAACEANNIATCMAKDKLYISVDDINAYRRLTAFMNVQSQFGHVPEEVFACEEAVAALLEIVEFAVPKTVLEDPGGQIETSCPKIAEQN